MPEMAEIVVPDSALAALPAVGTPLLVALSGGRDSMTLLTWLLEIGSGPLAVVHLDHGLRAESAADAAWIKKWCAAQGVSCTIERRELAALPGGRAEVVGRRARLELFATVARRCGIAWVVTAHHRDDQIETVLGNLLRGAGPLGAAGMPWRRDLGDGITLVRPWLAVERSTIAAWAQAWAVSWREDASNRDCRYRRNFLRHRVVPTLEAGAPGFGAALLGWSQDQAVAARRLWHRAQAVWDGRQGERLCAADWQALTAEERRFLWRALCVGLACPLNRGSLRRLEALAGGAIGARLSLGRWMFTRHRAALAWEPAWVAAPMDEPRPAIGTVTLSGRCYRSSPGPWDGRIPADPWQAVVDAAAVEGVLVWRTGLSGERWRPLGFPGSCSLRRWLGQRGVPARQRAATVVAADQRGVLWVPGQGLAERVRVGPGTARVLHLQVAATDPPQAVLEDPAGR